MNALTEVIASFRKRAQDLEKMAADLEQLAVNERITTVPSPDNSNGNSNSTPVSAESGQSSKTVVNSKVTVQSAPTPPPPTLPLPQLAKKKRENKTGRVLTHRGLRANVLRYLITGEATASTVANILVAPYDKVKTVMVNLVNEGLATREIRSVGAAGNVRKYEVFILTSIGRDEAQWFVDNPDIMIRNKQAVNNANKHTTPAAEARPN